MNVYSRILSTTFFLSPIEWHTINNVHSILSINTKFSYWTILSWNVFLVDLVRYSRTYNPTWLSMGISDPRSRLSMPIGNSYRLFGVTFSDGSRARRWALSMGPLTATGEITEFDFEGSRLNERKKGRLWVAYRDEPSIPIGDICRTGWRLDSITCTYDCETSTEASI